MKREYDRRLDIRSVVATTLSVGSPSRVLRGMRVAGVAIALGAALLAATAGSVFAWSPSAFSPTDEQLLFSLTNQDRASAGLNGLVNDSYLHKEAEWRAKDMGDRNYFSHQIPPSNNMVFTYMQSDGYCFKVAGENIGLSTYGDDVATNRIETAFMGSPSHRANILGTWGRMGVGAYQAADGHKLYAVLFSQPCGATVSTPAPARTPAPPRPTRAPTPVPTPTAAPTDTPTPSPTATPTAVPSPSPISTRPSDPLPSVAPGGSATTTSTVGTVPSLRVYVKTTSQGPLDSLFHSLFGGLFGR
jgi:uncharacterized protein YkwD